MTHPPRRICILASTRLDRQALLALLQSGLQMAVASEAGFSAVDIWSAMRSNPDLAIASADQATPAIRDCLQMIPRLRAETKILILGGTLDATCLQSWTDCKIAGYVYKDGGLDELKTAIEAIWRDESFFSPGTKNLICDQPHISGRPHLSPRESELLPLLAQGMKLRDAATKMTVSYKTADAYRTSLLRKLGIRDRVELARYALREGIVTL